MLTTTSNLKDQMTKLVAYLAALENNSETEGGLKGDDAIVLLNSLIGEARQITGFNGYRILWCPAHQCPANQGDCDCQFRGQCLTCGTMCDDEGICPACAALERAKEELREAEALDERSNTSIILKHSALLQAQRLRDAALKAPVDNCRNCGKPLTLGDMVNGVGCVDEGDGPEAGAVFVYCSSQCRKAHSREVD